MKLKIGIAAIFLCVSCNESEAGRSRRLNIEVEGSPECLARIVDELDLPAAAMPKFKNNLGRMEFGPIESASSEKIVDRIERFSCIQTIRRRPCATPLTDIDICNAP